MRELPIFDSSDGSDELEQRRDRRVLDRMFVDFGRWLAGTSWSTGLHESFYMFNWIESSHVLTLMLCLGMLFIIDLRMLGVAFKNVPASQLAARLDMPMNIGFALMFLTGILLFTAIPDRYSQSVWFRLKMILLVLAFINALVFRKHMHASVTTWDTAAIPPKRTRIAAATSLTLWTLIVVCGRFIAYDWYDCGKAGNSAFINWAAGCTAEQIAVD
jgi:hypothetical protein